MKKQRGLSLLEMLLVITIVGIISITVLKSWNSLNRQHNLAAAKQDVAALQQATLRYFQIESCDQNGNFSGNLNPSLATLGLAKLQNGRAPWILTYNAAIIAIGYNPLHKPLYEFKFTAEPTTNLNTETLNLIANALDAKLVNAKLTWLVPIAETNPARQRLIVNGINQCIQ